MERLYRLSYLSGIALLSSRGERWLRKLLRGEESTESMRDDLCRTAKMLNKLFHYKQNRLGKEEIQILEQLREKISDDIWQTLNSSSETIELAMRARTVPAETRIPFSVAAETCSEVCGAALDLFNELYKEG